MEGMEEGEKMKKTNMKKTAKRKKTTNMKNARKI